MNTYVSTPDLVRDDVAAPPLATELPETQAAAATVEPVRRPGRFWALTGLGAGLLTAGGTTYLQMSGNPMADPTIATDPDAVLARIATMAGPLTVFHVALTMASLLMLVFAAGVHRRLRLSAARESLAPGIATAGLLLTAVMLMAGTALDTEIIFGAPRAGIDAGTAIFYAHWIATVPWVWTGTGLTGLAIAAAALRARALPRWIGVVGLVLGLLTLGIGLSPLQYLAAPTGQLWIMVTALGLVIGDKAHRQGR